MESRQAWIVVWATFVCLGLIFGVSYSFAAFFESFAKEFSAQRADVSWIFGLCGLVYFVLGALAGLLADRWGPRLVCMLGMLLISLGLFWTSLAQSLSSVYISYGLLVGLGIAFVYTPSIALRTPTFKWLYLGTLLGAPVMFIPFAHISAAARDAGVAEAQAVGLVGLVGIGSLIGRFAIGWLADRLGRVKTLMLMQCLMGVSYLVWAAAEGQLMFALFALWFGLSYGSIVSLLPAICMDLFGGRAVSSIIGTLYSGAALGNLLGPVLAGQVFDMTGSYSLVIWITLGISAMATFSCWRILKHPQKQH